jgi:pimeloyl-ACP methyl ester carboxylesterase
LAGAARRALARRPDVVEIARGYLLLRDPQRRRAFLDLVRAMVSVRGQRIGATSRLYLAEAMPVLLVYGDRDTLIPPRHAEEAHQAIPGSRLELLEGVRHFPQLEVPDCLLGAIERFLLETPPARLTAADLAPLVRAQSEMTQ